MTLTRTHRTALIWAGLALLVAALSYGVSELRSTAATAKPVATAGKASPSNCGNCQGNNGSGAGNGGGSESGSPGKALTVSVDSVDKIAPGLDGVVSVRVTNPNNQDVLLTRVAGTVTSVTTRDESGIPWCNKDWVVLGEYSGQRLIGKNQSATVAMPVSFDNKPDVNQDNCKDVTYTFSFTAYGQQP